MRISDWSSDVCSSDLALSAQDWRSQVLEAPRREVRFGHRAALCHHPGARRRNKKCRNPPHRKRPSWRRFWTGQRIVNSGSVTHCAASSQKAVGRTPISANSVTFANRGNSEEGRGGKWGERLRKE